MLKEVFVPDIGAYSNVDVIEVLVAPGDKIKVDTSLITLETEKASLEVPSPVAGIIKEIKVKPGDKVSEGSLILSVEVDSSTIQDTAAKTEKTSASSSSREKSNVNISEDDKGAMDGKSVQKLKEIFVPDIGAYANVDVIEVSVKPGDIIKKDTSLITVETEKASLEVPAPFGGVVKAVKVKVGDKVSESSLILTVETAEEMPLPASAVKSASISTPPSKTDTLQRAPTKGERIADISITPVKSGGIVHAGPSVRRFARELGADLSRITGSGPKNRIVKIDVQAYVKRELARVQSGITGAVGGEGFSVAPWPQVDFAKFGEITKEPLSRIKKLSGSFLHRNWVMVPHVTQFDDADVTELEQFRKEQQTLAEQQGVKLTPLVFIMKAVVAGLKACPMFNASLDASGSELILKKYFHIGVAVDTPNGLVVPVVRDVDDKGLFQLAKELGDLSAKARKGQLTAQEMQGSSFSISSLGGIGGTAFTPIINVPDVAILGVSKAQIKPVFETATGDFKPRLLMPLSLSYDHRVIDGAEGARFITFLVKQLSDIRRLLL